MSCQPKGSMCMGCSNGSAEREMRLGERNFIPCQHETTLGIQL